MTHMRFLPTRIHGLIDYAWGFGLLAMPYLLGWPAAGWPSWVAWAAGTGAILYSLATDYEWGLVALVPMPAHLGLDALAGAGLAALPLAVALESRVGFVFAAFGLFAVAASLVTETRPNVSSRRPILGR